MADSSTGMPQIIEVNTSPLWYRITATMLSALFLAFLISLGLVIRDHLKVEPLTNVYRQCQKPLIQYRLERGTWPADFNFSNPSPELNSYGFSAAVKKSLADSEIEGQWKFTLSKSPFGAAKPTIIFQPAQPDVFSRRVLIIVDERLDDGVPETGNFRVTDDLAAFKLKDE